MAQNVNGMLQLVRLFNAHDLSIRAHEICVSHFTGKIRPRGDSDPIFGFALYVFQKIRAQLLLEPF